VSRTNVDFTKEFTCLSLCTGYGGLELGVKRVMPSLRTICYVEIEMFACANLVSKIEAGKMDAAPIWTDLKTFNAEPFRGRVDIVMGGFPCQPFSLAGKRQGTDDPRHLWPHIARIVEAVRPVWCVFENVAGHLTLGFPEVYRSLRNMGYSVEAGLFTAWEVGAPATRQRLFVLANATNSGIPGGQLPSNYRGEYLVSYKQNERITTRTKITRCTPPPWPPRLREISDVPRMDDGLAYWMDRLRLLGNGVIPAQAEKAIRTLGALFE